MTTLYQDLIAARARIDHPSKWCQGALRRRRGNDGEQFCAVGATMTEGKITTGHTIYALECVLLQRQYHLGLPKYNDTHSHAEVMHIFDLAIEAACEPISAAVKKIMEDAVAGSREKVGVDHDL